LLPSWGQAQERGVPPLGGNPPQDDWQTTEDWNRRLQELVRTAGDTVPSKSPQEYRIGPDDLLEITVFEASDLNRVVRVTASGEISMPLLGAVRASGLTARELEFVLQELLRRTYMQDPHVGVFVREMESHPVSVFGAVQKPGVYQLRSPKSLVEVLSMAEGLADDAGDTVIITRAGAHRGIEGPIGTQSPPEESSEREESDPSSWIIASELGADLPPVSSARTETPGGSIEVNLKALLETADSDQNIIVYPGDFVKVNRAGIVYVVGEVKRPGGFILRTNENISVLQALSLAEGLTALAARGKARIIRTNASSGERTEIPMNLARVLEGEEPDPMLQPKDIVFVPTSAMRRGFYRAAEAAITTVTGLIIWRR